MNVILPTSELPQWFIITLQQDKLRSLEIYLTPNLASIFKINYTLILNEIGWAVLSHVNRIN